MFSHLKQNQIKQPIENKKHEDDSHTPRASYFWYQKFNIRIDESFWSLYRNATKEVRLIELQWKIPHNIYPTNILLNKRKVTETDTCTYCNNIIDYRELFFSNANTCKDYGIL